MQSVIYPATRPNGLLTIWYAAEDIFTDNIVEKLEVVNLLFGASEVRGGETPEIEDGYSIGHMK